VNMALHVWERRLHARRSRGS